MKLIRLSVLGTFALLAPVLAQQTLMLPRPALEGVTAVARGVKTACANSGTLTSAGAISDLVANQLTKLNNYFTNTVFPSVNPQRFMPGTPGILRERTCDERKAIFTAYKNLFIALADARKAMQAAICRTQIKLPTGLALQPNYRIDPLYKKAKDAIQATENNVRRLWDRNYNQYNSFDFFVYDCKAKNNSPSCPGSPCFSNTLGTPRCPVLASCCYYGFVDGKNPNKNQCFSNEAEVEDVAGADGLSAPASFGWVNLLDCRQCATGNTLPTCVAIAAVCL
ncbi:hypothetical protein ABW20_dc0102712 [Dactylellina cionopaga]|nr:hypothetical protein ABW20_dc0102712 [Dactylellina cionopaga]